MGSSSNHSASGSAFGYFFQLERALYWLAISNKSNSIVGIETDDDISVRTEDEIVWEQDKCSTKPDGYPLSDRSINLWKTLSIWIKAIREKEIEIDNIKFYLITNKARPDSLAKRLGKLEKNEREIELCISDVRRIGNELLQHIDGLRRKGMSPSSKLDYYVTSIVECDDVLLGSLIKSIYYLDSTTVDDNNKEIASALHIPEDLPHDEIIGQLIGWLFEKIMALWQADKPAWIKRNELDEHLWQIRCAYLTKVFKETATEDLLPVSDEDRKANLGKLFVRQLRLLNYEGIDDMDDIIVKAVGDYLHCHSERTKYALEGWVTRAQFNEFDKNLEIRWKKIFGSKKTQIGKERWNCEEAIGSQIYFDTTNYREELAGQKTIGYYLTEGTYHMLSDDRRVGWHPRFKTLL